ncbi:MAG: class I SAM-dependent methyltransferase, partial [Acidimicrobiia bacterium]
MAFVPGRGSALDLGCSTGSKATRLLAAEFTFGVGVDISPKSVRVAWLAPASRRSPSSAARLAP